MKGVKHDLDWSAQPPPWSWIGPQFRAICDGITPNRTATAAAALRAPRQKHQGGHRRIRACLGCGRDFVSTNATHRLCDKCKDRAGGLSEVSL